MSDKVEKVARAIPDAAVEAALLTFYDGKLTVEEMWRINGEDLRPAMRAAIEAALAAMGERGEPRAAWRWRRKGDLTWVGITFDEAHANRLRQAGREVQCLNALPPQASARFTSIAVDVNQDKATIPLEAHDGSLGLTLLNERERGAPVALSSDDDRSLMRALAASGEEIPWPEEDRTQWAGDVPASPRPEAAEGERRHCNHCAARFLTVWEREQHEREAHLPARTAEDSSAVEPSDSQILEAVRAFIVQEKRGAYDDYDGGYQQCLADLVKAVPALAAEGEKG